MSTASEILSTYWTGTLPVDPSAIARAMGIRVQMSLGMTESGKIELEGNSPVITVNGTEAHVRQRFTIAHEIGHFALGHLRGSVRMFRDPVSNFSSQTSNPDERAANAFSAQLLMPAETLQFAVLNRGVHDVSRLSSIFDVSQAAMRFRLTNLGLIRD